MAPHSSTLAWKIPWMEEPGRLAVHGVAKSQTRLSDFTFTFHFHALQKEMATHSSVLAWRIPRERERGAWWAAIYAAAQSRTRLSSTFRSLIHFEFIIVYGVGKCSSYILLRVAVQFSQHHLLRRLSFLQAALLPPVVDQVATHGWIYFWLFILSH